MTRVVFITDDVANKEMAEKEGTLVATAEEYIKSLIDYPMLIDKYARKDIEKDRDTQPLFPVHLSMNEIIEGVRNQRLLQGPFQASRENYLEGSVSIEGFENPVRYMNTDFQIDIIDLPISFSDLNSRTRVPKSCC